jgi:hypothetical protein
MKIDDNCRMTAQEADLVPAKLEDMPKAHRQRGQRPIMGKIEQDVRDAIIEADGTPFVRPAWTNDKTIYTTGFYWEGLDGDRYYFETREEAERDLASEAGDL